VFISGINAPLKRVSAVASNRIVFIGDDRIPDANRGQHGIKRIPARVREDGPSMSRGDFDKTIQAGKDFPTHLPMGFGGRLPSRLLIKPVGKAKSLQSRRRTSLDNQRSG
jgi:hypothetical protein